LSHADVLEDEDSEWITDIEPKEGGEQEQEGEIGNSSQGVAAQGQEKGKRGNQNLGNWKRKRLILTQDDEESAASSFEGEDDNDMPSDFYN
jgi:hypothetical protein